MKIKSNFYVDIVKMKFWKYVTTQQCKLKGKKLNGALRYYIFNFSKSIGTNFPTGTT